MNSITIAGRLTKDCEIKMLESGTQVASFSLADNKKVKGVDTTQFFDCSVWGNRAETASTYLKKGGLITISGQLEVPRIHEGKVYQKVSVNDFTLPPRQNDNEAPKAAAPQDEDLPF
jgi:single-strand DNA-binding protein